MKTATLTGFEMRALGWDALVERLGAWGAARFAMQTERGHGDYSDLRHGVLGKLTVDELLAKKASRPRAARKRP